MKSLEILRQNPIANFFDWLVKYDLFQDSGLLVFLKTLKNTCGGVLILSSYRLTTSENETRLQIHFRFFYEVNGTGYNMNVKVWLYAFTLHLYYKRDSRAQMFSREPCRILRTPFFYNTPGRVLLTLFKSNKYMKVSFLFTFFYRKK